eukprot:5213360-Ditylum_brightwellii.AAC.1
MASSNRNSQANHQDKEDMSSVASLLVSSTLESDNNHKTKQDKKGQYAALLFNLERGPASRPVHHVIFATSLMMEPEAIPDKFFYLSMQIQH